jgi:adenosylcobinamide kinase / adenosylcobinamide-phosphate guanylyltransferase
VQQAQRRSVTLVLGGARSGKSRFAQKLAERASAVAFVATAKAVDDEMRDKIRRHQQQRPTHWRTVEEPLELGRVVIECAPHCDILLVDCLTLFVANVLEAGPEMLDARIDSLVDALRNVQSSVVLVSNEVGSGVVPAYPLGRQFRELLGEVNQRVASVADNVLFMVAGLPLALKGQLEVRP